LEFDTDPAKIDKNSLPVISTDLSAFKNRGGKIICITASDPNIGAHNQLLQQHCFLNGTPQSFGKLI
jgi:hypothetical protein